MSYYCCSSNEQAWLISAGGAQVEAGWAEPPRATPHFNHCKTETDRKPKRNRIEKREQNDICGY